MDNMAIRDMSQLKFNEAVRRHGFRAEGFMGYYDLGIEGHHAAVSVHNAGKNRRARLAYLLKSREEYLKRMEAASPTKDR
jgi:hypothetical protein